MEDTLDIDELFADDGTLSLAPVPIPPALVYRVEEQTVSGCCQKIAWSRLGSIASITADGRGVDIQVLMSSPQNAKWGLSKQWPMKQVHSIHEGQQLCHLSWNPSGSACELVVMDVLGRISILNIGSAINKLVVTRVPTRDQEDDLNAIAGMVWLNVDRQFPWYRSATRSENQYQYSLSQYRPLGPFHPLKRPAFFCITRSGMLRLIFQQVDGRWADYNMEVESASSASEVITHASFCSDRAKRFRLYRIQLRWSVSGGAAPSADGQVPFVPDVSITSVKFGLSDEDLTSQEMHNVSRPPWQLSILELVSMPPHGASLDAASPLVLAVFSNVLEQQAAGFQEYRSAVVRWELHKLPSTPHPIFVQLGASAQNSQPHNQGSYVYDYRRSEATIVDKVILGVHPTSLGTALAIAYSDGSIEFRDRTNFGVYHAANDDSGVVMGLAHAALSFHSEGHFVLCADMRAYARKLGLYTTLSPNNCAAATLDADGSVKLILMSFASGLSMAVKLDTVVAALSMQYANAHTHYTNSDDVLAVAQQVQLRDIPNFERDFISELYRTLSQPADFVDQQNEKLAPLPSIQRILSVQEALGRKVDHQFRSLPGKLAWVTLNLRFAAISFTFMWTPNAKHPGFSVHVPRTDVILTLFGMIRWSIDLISYITDELYSLERGISVVPNMLQRVNAHLEDENTCALPLVMCSLPRHYLRHVVRCLSHLSVAVVKALHESRDAAQRQTLRHIYDFLASAPVKMGHFEAFIRSVDAAVKAAYHHQQPQQQQPQQQQPQQQQQPLGGGVTPARRAALEKGMLVTAQVPVELLPVLREIFGRFVPVLHDEVQPAEVFYGDYSWLGVTDDAATTHFHRLHHVDVMRKFVLKQQHHQDGSSSGASKNSSSSTITVNATTAAAAAAAAAAMSEDGGPVRLRQCARCASVMVESRLPASIAGAGAGATGATGAAGAGAGAGPAGAAGGAGGGVANAAAGSGPGGAGANAAVGGGAGAGSASTSASVSGPGSGSGSGTSAPPPPPPGAAAPTGVRGALVGADALAVPGGAPPVAPTSGARTSPPVGPNMCLCGSAWVSI